MSNSLEWGLSAQETSQSSTKEFAELESLAKQLEKETENLLRCTIHTQPLVANNRYIKDLASFLDDSDSMSQSEMTRGKMYELTIIAPYLGNYTYTLLRVLQPVTTQYPVAIRFNHPDHNWVRLEQANEYDEYLDRLKEVITISRPFLSILVESSKEEAEKRK
ncbi:MAG: hypothetical protein ACOCZ8_00775 [Bacteroidota bacterium]